MAETVHQRVSCRRCGRVFLFAGELYDYVATLIRAGWQADARNQSWACQACARLEQTSRPR